MNIKSLLKKSKIITSLYNYVCSLITVFSPTLNTKIRFRIAKGKSLDLKNPKSLDEKISWLKLYNYNHNKLVFQCADKYRVREYIKSRHCSEILNELYGVYNKVDEVPWEKLPKKFVLKWNTGSGGNLICTDKDTLDIKMAIKKMKKMGRRKYHLPYAELQYKHIKPLLICEKYLESDQGKLPYDYKVYCFNGKPMAILVIMGRNEDLKAVFMSPEWEFISYVDKYKKVDKLPERPEDLDTMIRTSAMLSEPFPFVRIDYYHINGKTIFGEMTFTPAGGINMAQTNINGKSMGELLNL